MHRGLQQVVYQTPTVCCKANPISRTDKKRSATVGVGGGHAKAATIAHAPLLSVTNHYEIEGKGIMELGAGGLRDLRQTLANVEIVLPGIATSAADSTRHIAHVENICPTNLR